MGDRADFMFDGQSLSACSTFGCVLVDCTGVGEAKDIPEQLKVRRTFEQHVYNITRSLFLSQSALRPIHLLTPDMQYVTEVLLMGKGFSEAYSLGRKLTSFMDHLENQVAIATSYMDHLENQAGTSCSPPLDVSEQQQLLLRTPRPEEGHHPRR